MKLMKSLLNIFLGVSAALLIVGCMTFGGDFNESNVSQIKKGETTEADLIGFFGKPASRSITSEGTTILMWSYYKTAYGGATDGKTLTVMLGSDGKVANFTASGGGM